MTDLFLDTIFKYISFNENYPFLIHISLKFVYKGSVDSNFVFI